MDKENKIILCRENEFPFEFLEPLLKARIRSNQETGEKPYDEEVNIYITNLLNSVTDSRKMNELSRYIVKSEVNLNEMISRTSNLDNRNKYQFFKTNGDYILVRLGVFDSPYDINAGRYTKEIANPQKKEEQMKEKGRMMYSMAASALMHIQGKTALFYVFEQISDEGLDKYVNLIRIAFENNEIKGSTKNAIDELVKEPSFRTGEEEQKKRLFQLYSDHILKTYSDYMRDKDPQLKERISEIEKKMQVIKPDFRFKCIE